MALESNNQTYIVLLSQQLIANLSHIAAFIMFIIVSY